MPAENKTRRSRTTEANGIIRPYEGRDREAVREICRRTAYRNRGSTGFFEDDELFADYWTSYYTDHEPESSFVIEEDGEVIGYLIGCIDTRRMVRVMARSVVPQLLGKMLWRFATFRYRQPGTRRMMRWIFFHSWKEAPHVPLDRYPAHYHCNILRKGYGKRYYTSLALTFLDYLEKRGVERLHGQVEEPADKGVFRQMVTQYGEAHGIMHMLEHFSEKPSSFQRIVLGVDKPMINRAWGARVKDYRGWLEWTAKKHHM